MSYIAKRALATGRQTGPFPPFPPLLNTQVSGPTKEFLPSQDDMRLVVSIDITLLTILAIMTLFILPRVMARYMHPDAWRLGHSFKSNNTCAQASPPAYEVKVDGDIEFLQKSVPAPTHLPRNCKTWSALIPELRFVLQYRFLRGISVAQAIVFLGYTLVLGIPALIHSNPVTNPVRTGIIAVSQVPVVFALACKSNIVGTLLGKGYEQINDMHRVVGRVLIIYANVHSLGYSE